MSLFLSCSKTYFHRNTPCCLDLRHDLPSCRPYAWVHSLFGIDDEWHAWFSQRGIKNGVATCLHVVLSLWPLPGLMCNMHVVCTRLEHLALELSGNWDFPPIHQKRLGLKWLVNALWKFVNTADLWKFCMYIAMFQWGVKTLRAHHGSKLTAWTARGTNLCVSFTTSFWKRCKPLYIRSSWATWRQRSCKRSRICKLRTFRRA